MRTKSESESVTINITFALIVKIHTDHEKKMNKPFSSNLDGQKRKREIIKGH
jgi:hypothetical protein